MMMIVGKMQKVLVAIIILDIPLQLDIHLFYRPEVAELGAIEGLGISVTTLSLAVLYALWLGEFMIRGGFRLRPLPRASLPLALYLGFSGLSVVVARDVELSIFEISLLLQMFLLYVYIAGSVRTRQDVLFIVRMLFVGLILESLIMIGLQLVGRDFSIAGISSRIDVYSGSAGQFYRVAGTVGSPNTAGGYLGLLLAPAIGLLLTPLGRRYRWLAAFAFGLGGLALVLTFSRGAWLAFALSIMILFLLGWHHGWLPVAVPVVVLVVVALVSLPFHDTILIRLFNLKSALSRIPLTKLAFRMIADNPVLGIGANNFAAVMEQYTTWEFAGAWLYKVHNKYLLVWTETGIGGLLAFIWFLLATLRRGWQCLKSNDRLLAPLALGFTAGIVGHMAHMLVETFQSRPLVQLLWLVAGLVAAMSMMDDDGASEVADSLRQYRNLDDDEIVDCVD